MGVKNNETGIGTAAVAENRNSITTNNNTTYCRISASCEMVVDIKGIGIIHVNVENGQDIPIFLFNLSEKLHEQMRFQLENNALQISTSFDWSRCKVIDPNKVVGLKLVLTEGSLKTLITAYGQVMLKQFTEISDTRVATEIADIGAEAGKDEDADVDDQDRVYVEVSAPGEAPDEEGTDETAEAIVNKDYSAIESAEGAMMRMKKAADDIDADDADDDEEEDYVEISDPDSSDE